MILAFRYAQIHIDEIRRKYRSYDELKKDFQSLDMKIQTDQEIITDLVEQLNKTDSNEHQKTILTDLEFYLHQVDRSLYFLFKSKIRFFSTTMQFSFRI